MVWTEAGVIKVCLWGSPASMRCYAIADDYYVGHIFEDC